MSDDNIVNKKRNVHYHNLHYVYKHVPFSRSFKSHTKYTEYTKLHTSLALVCYHPDGQHQRSACYFVGFVDFVCYIKSITETSISALVCYHPDGQHQRSACYFVTFVSFVCYIKSITETSISAHEVLSLTQNTQNTQNFIHR